MVILREYNFNGRHYGLVELDDGSRVEIKDKDPLAKAAAMQLAGAFAPIIVVPKEKVLVDFSNAEITVEIEKRNLKQVIKGIVV